MSAQAVFELQPNGVLVVRSGADVLRTIDQIDGMLISAATPVSDHVVLLLTKTKKWGTAENLVCLNLRAEVVWRAPILESSPYPKEYASVALSDDGKLVAHTWGGIRATIDAATGRVLSEVFVK